MKCMIAFSIGVTVGYIVHMIARVIEDWLDDD